MRASRMGDRPKPRPRVLTLDRAFFAGVALVVGLAFWVHGDEPPGLPGEPNLRPYRGAPVLVVYGAPGCATCVRQWQALAPALPEGLTVIHLVARQADDDPRPADAAAARRWAAALGVAPEAVLPAALPKRQLPAVLLRNDRSRWRFEHVGALDARSLAGLQRAIAREGLSPADRDDSNASPP